jgi:hypothetical protein
MTETQFRKRTKSLKREVNKLIDDRIEKILRSGALSLEDHEDDYRLPKIFMSAMGAEISFQFRPSSSDGQKEVKNIERML